MAKNCDIINLGIGIECSAPLPSARKKLNVAKYWNLNAFDVFKPT